MTARLESARFYVVSSDGDATTQVGAPCAAIDGGADVVQLRNKTAVPALLLDGARRVREHSLAHSAIFIVNDHLDLAIEAGADGVHLGQDDLPIAAARARWNGILGLSTHSLEQALEAEANGADYIGVGPVYATPTKPGRPAVGVELVEAVAPLVSIPWFAIGGIDGERLDAVLAAGATRVAVVRAVCDAADPAAAAAEMLLRIQQAAGARV